MCQGHLSKEATQSMKMKRFRYNKHVQQECRSAASGRLRGMLTRNELRKLIVATPPPPEVASKPDGHVDESIRTMSEQVGLIRLWAIIAHEECEGNDNERNFHRPHQPTAQGRKNFGQSRRLASGGIAEFHEPFHHVRVEFAALRHRQKGWQS